MRVNIGRPMSMRFCIGWGFNGGARRTIEFDVLNRRHGFDAQYFGCMTQRVQARASISTGAASRLIWRNG